MSTVLEKEIESYLNKKIKMLSGLSLKWVSSVTGVPDRIVILPKKILFVELKTKTGQVSKRQKLVFKQLEDLGFPVYVLRSKEDVEAFVDEATKS